jgi:hypothetical protein
MAAQSIADWVTLIVFVLYALGLLAMFLGLVRQMTRGKSPIRSGPGGGDGISLSKLQMYLWTLMLAFAWLYQLVKHPGQFPQLPNQALLLMGISGAAYLGAKHSATSRSKDTEKGD